LVAKPANFLLYRYSDNIRTQARKNKTNYFIYNFIQTASIWIIKINISYLNIFKASCF